MEDKLINCEEEDIVPNGSENEANPSRHGNQNQPGTSYSSGDGQDSSTADVQEPHIRDSPLPEDHEPPTLSNRTKQHKHKACPLRSQFKLCKKRVLSSSTENLLGENGPRKSFKFCQGLMKRWFHISDKSGPEESSAASYEEDQNVFTDVISQVTGQEIRPLDTGECSTSGSQEENSSGRTGISGGLSGSCAEMLSEVTYMLNERSFEEEHQLLCTLDEAVPLTNRQDGSVCDLGHGEARTDDNLEDIDEYFSTSKLHLNRLPPQLLAHVFSFLTVPELLRTAAFVCKHWHRVSHFWTLWHQMRFRDHPNVTDGDLVELCSRHCSVGLLDLSDCLRITDEGLEKALVHCKMLRDLFLIRCSQLTDRAFLSIANHCANLTHIDVTGCSGLTDHALQSIAKGCPLLQKVRLKQCPLISDTSLQVIARSCPRLKVLMFMDSDKITDSTLEALASHSHYLEILCLQNCGIGPRGLAHVAKLHLLKKLDLSNLSTLTSDSVQEVARHCSLLDTLNLSLSRDVRDDCVLYVARLCKKLTTLFLISCTITDQALYGIGDNSALLEHLDVSWCSNVTDHGASYVSDRCPSLKYLGLIRCVKVSDTAVERMVEEHPGIHYSTFLLDSQRLIDKAREQGFVASE
ncbi:F-box/LRR-repeat protein 17-like [Patiria miniata]|uniref:F-box domain-containing protein n=1 Tax=Patiria miniata TaxID=46514 RepID=A0A914A2B6_PATMI|nr:F-box/LRR-repeat protein 17-like [Patiria miniata]XP_038057994.1 F-box/LRR-repeat protein 17-like [Patiria miniata]